MRKSYAEDDDHDYDRPVRVSRRRRAREGGFGLNADHLWWIVPAAAALLLVLAFVLPGLAGALAALAAIAIGLVFCVGGGLWLLVVAATDSVTQLLLCLFIPFYTLFYVASNFDETKRPFLLYALGLAMILLSARAADMHADRAERERLVEVRDDRPGNARPEPEEEPEPGLEPRPRPKPAAPATPPKKEAPKADPEGSPPFAVDPKAKAAGPTVYLGVFTPFAQRPGPWKYTVGGTGEDGKTPIRVNGRAYSYGISAHPPAAASGTWRASFVPGGEFRRFKGWGAINDSSGNPWSKVSFAVWGDGRKLWESSPLGKANESAEFDIDVTGVKVLTLETRVERSHLHAHAVWLDPWLER